MPIMGEVIRVFDGIREILNIPALLWLSTDVKHNLPTSHVVLYRYRCVATFEENQPVKSLSVSSKVLMSDRVSHFRYYSLLAKFRQLIELLVVKRQFELSMEATTPLKSAVYSENWQSKGQALLIEELLSAITMKDDTTCRSISF